MYIQPLFLLVLAATYKIIVAVEFKIIPGRCPSDGLMSFCEVSKSGGLCASTGEVSWSWCCVPGEQLCGNWGQECTGAGKLAGPDQVRCSATGGGPQTWCCADKYEDCVGPGLFNWCIAKNIHNPYNETSVASALKIQSEFFARTSTTLKSLGSSSSSSSPTASTSSSVTSTTSSTLSTSQASPSTSATPPANSSISNGAIGGIVVGGVAGMAMIAAAIYFGLRQRSDKKEKDSTGHLDGPGVYEVDAKQGVRPEVSEQWERAELPNPQRQQRFSELA